MIIYNPTRGRIMYVFVLAVAASSIRVKDAGSYPMPPEFYKLSEELVSWHIPWAKPYVGGIIKALIIAPRGAQRETIELAQRLSMDYTYILTLSPTELGWTEKSGPYAPADGISNNDVLRDLRQKLRADYDVILIGHFDWAAFPNDVLYDIMRKVHDGTGLVYTCSSFGRVPYVNEMLKRSEGEDKNRFVTTGIPFTALPVFQEWGAAKVVALRQFKNGRVATLDYGKALPHFQYLTPLVPDDVEWYTDLHYEYYMSLVIKSILWAAKREPTVFIRSWGEDGRKWSRRALSQAELIGTLVGQPAAGNLEAVMTVRSVGGAPALVRKLSFTIAGSDKDLSFPLAPLPRGRYFADIVLSHEGKSVNWATTFFDVETPVSIASVETDRKWYEPEQNMAVTVKLSASPTTDNRLTISVVDSLNRLVAKASPRIQADGLATCSFRLTQPLTITAKVKAVLTEGKDIVDEQCAGFSIVRRKWDDFLFCVWTAGHNFNERPRRLAFDQLQKAGVDTFTNSSTGEVGARRAAELGYWGIPYATRYSYDGKDLIRNPCLTDPKFLDAHLAQLEKTAIIQRPFDPQGYTLGDECYLAQGTDVCFSPTCIADFREWLRQEYPSVEALNASWGTNYQSFEEATPITLAEATQSNQIPRWVDHRRHMEFVYARMMQRARDAIRKGDPTARVGFDGPFDTNSYSGNDWWQLMQVFDLCNVYFHQPDEWEYVRSFARPGTLLGTWYGRYSFTEDEAYMRFFPWQTLLHGFNSVWWYAVYHGLSVCPMDAVTPSMTPYAYFSATTEEAREIKSGIGKALMQAQRLDDGIAIHYSQSSVHLSTALKGLGILYTTQRHWMAYLEDSGFQYVYRSYDQIEKEGIPFDRYRVLILPYSQAISQKEAEAITAFVRAGGTVIADVRPGIADEHGKRRQPGMLEELFGIERKNGAIDLKFRVDAELVSAMGDAPAQTKLPELTIDPNVVPTRSEALGKAGDTPILIVNDVGKGRAILLNFSVGAYNSVRTSMTGRTYWSVLRALLGLAHVRPRVQVRTVEGGLQQCEVVCFQDGAVEYVGFLKERCSPKEAAQSAEVVFTGAAHTYDARAGKYFGNGDRFTTTFEPKSARLITRLPYAVKSVAVKSRSATARAGQPVQLDLTLTASPGQLSRHWFHVAVFGPDKAERCHYAQNVPVINGKGEALIPLALNDPAGEWRITVRDVATGVKGAATLRVGGAR